MASRSADLGSGRELRFFLARAPGEGPVELYAGEHEHALRVLRLGPGDRVVGLDGRGAAWPLAVASVERERVVLVEDGPPRRDPPPGAPGAGVPWVEIAAPWPKGGRAEEMLDRLTQLGVAAVGPLACERAGPGSSDLSPARRERFERVLREACKQCGRTWLPVLRDTVRVGNLEPHGPLVLLERGAPTSLVRWARDREERGEAGWTSARPLRLLVGPEGGFTESEREALRARGASAASLAPLVLRVETAAEAAMAVLAATFVKAPGK